MKPVSRHPVTAHALGLIDRIARNGGFRLADSEALRDSVTGIAAEPFPAHLLHGKRVEAMFGYILAELDHCLLIKEEDAGEALAQPDLDVAIPDYRVLTKDGRMLLIEVKNVHGKSGRASLTMKPDYATALRAYAQLNGCPVMVAVYWSRWNCWTLVGIDSLKRRQARLELTFPDALVANRMGEVGDYSLGIRTPLRLRLRCDPVQLSDNQIHIQFRVRVVEVYCADQLLTERSDRAIAFFLMLFGRWQEPGKAIVDEQRVMTAVEFVAAPEEPDTNYGFDIVGAASELLSKAYRHVTVSTDGEVERLRPSALPTPITGVLPLDYKSSLMPLWRFTQVHDGPASAVREPSRSGPT